MKPSKTSKTLPSRSSKTSKDQSLLIRAHFGNVRWFHSLPDPVALFQRIDEHELDTDVVAVRSFETVQDFPVEIEKNKSINLTFYVPDIRFKNKV